MEPLALLRRIARTVRCSGPGVRVALALAATLALTSVSSAREPEPPSVFDLEGLTFVASQGSAPEIVLEAAIGRVDPAAEVADLERVRAQWFGPGGELRLSLSCERGRLELASSDFHMAGRVQARTADGRRFSSERLRYEHAAGVASTDAPVLIREGERTLRGGGLRYHVREGRLRLLGGAAVVETP